MTIKAFENLTKVISILFNHANPIQLVLYAGSTTCQFKPGEMW